MGMIFNLLRNKKSKVANTVWQMQIRTTDGNYTVYTNQDRKQLIEQMHELKISEGTHVIIQPIERISINN